MSTPICRQALSAFTLCAFLLIALCCPATAESIDPIAYVGQRTVNAENAIVVIFTKPLDGTQDINRYLQLYARDGGKIDGAWALDTAGTIAYFNHVEADTHYEVHVRRGLVFSDGSTLDSSRETQVKTREVKPVIAFAGRGSILPGDLSKGLPVTTLNVAKANVDFFRVKSNHIVSFVNYCRNRTTIEDYAMRRLSGKVDLVYSARYDLDPKKDVMTRETLPVEAIAPLAEPGIYMAVLQPAGAYPYSNPFTWFTISDLGIHARRFPNHFDCTTQALSTGDVLKDVTLIAFSSKGQEMARVVTDSQGFATFPRTDPEVSLIMAVHENHLTLLPVDGSALDLSAFDTGTRPYQPIDFFLYGPRNLYRPGETVIIDGLLRDADGQRVNGYAVNVSILQPDGQEYRNFTWHAEPGNTYHTEFTLPADGPTGRWQMICQLGSEFLSEYTLHVEDFMPERMKLILAGGDTDPARIPHGRDLELSVEGAYLYGAPAGGNRVDSNVTITLLREAVPSLEGFEFGDPDGWKRQAFTTADLTLDENGKGILSLSHDHWSTAATPLTIRFHTNLYEEGGRPVSRDKVYHYWPADRLIGIRPLFDDHHTPSDSAAAFEVVAADENGNRLSLSGAEAVLIREYPDSYWEYSESRGWERVTNYQNYPVASQTVDIQADGAATVHFSVEWGPYRLVVRDPETGLVTALRFRAGWSEWGDGVNEETARPDQIVMSLDKPAYAPGDTAVVTLKAPEAGKAIVTVESDTTLYRNVLTLTSNTTTVSIPVDKNWRRHDLYIHAMVIRPGDKKRKITPKRAIGLIHLPLDREDRRLDVAIDAPKKILPDQTLDVTVSVNNTHDAPVRVTLAAVDVGVLNITRFETPNPFNAFFGKRRFDVDAYDVYNRLIENQDGDLSQLAFGGDMAMSALMRGGDKPLTDVRIVSLYHGAVETDANGMVVIPLSIPEFNGTLRLMAVAFSDDAFGSADRELTVAAPVVAEMAMPRFLAMGDTSTLALELRNLSGFSQELDIRISGTPPVAFPALSQTMRLANKKTLTLPFPVTAASFPGTGDITLTVGGIRVSQDVAPKDLTRSWKLGVRPAYPAVTRQWRKVLQTGEQFTFDPSALSPLIPDLVRAELTLSDRPMININEHIKSLHAYPYGCLEQTTSGIYPQIFLSDTLFNQLAIESDAAAARKTKIDTGIQRIFTLQKENGGFGLWDNQGYENGWLTAYVVDFLLSARNFGYAIPESRLNLSIKRLSDYLLKPKQIVIPYSTDADHTRFATQAYAGYVLSRLRKAPLGTLRTLMDTQADECQSPLPMVHLGLAFAAQGDMKRARSAVAAAAHITRKKEVYLADYGSRLRDAAMGYFLLKTWQPDTPVAETFLMTLETELRSRQWLSTQEQNSLVLAAIRLYENPGTKRTAVLTTAPASVSLSVDRLTRRTFSHDTMASGLSVTAKEGPIYLNMLLSGYSETPPPAAGNLLSIDRHTFDVRGEPVTLDRVKGGDLVLVRLTVTAAAERLSDALIVDLIPAGFEIENPNLSTSYAMDGIVVGGKTVQEWKHATELTHEEFRDDRYVAAIDTGYPGNTSTLFYLMRAVTPGTYQIPNAYGEDMYRPYIRCVGEPADPVRITTSGS